MAKSTTFNWQNASEFDTKLYAVSQASSYIEVQDGNVHDVTLKNTTTPIMQDEVVKIYSSVDKGRDFLVTPANPDLSKKPIQRYGVRLDAIARTTDPETGLVVDHPVSGTLTLYQEMSEDLTAAVMTTFMKRLSSMFFKNDGSSRIAELQRDALKPQTN